MKKLSMMISVAIVAAAYSTVAVAAVEYTYENDGKTYVATVTGSATEISGTAIAVFLNLKFKDAILPVVLGNLVAGLIISGLASLCLAFWTIEVLDYILYGLFALAIILLVVVIIKILTRKPQEKTKADKD